MAMIPTPDVGRVLARLVTRLGSRLPGAAAVAVEDDRGRRPTAVRTAEQFVTREFNAARLGRPVTLVMFGFCEFDTFAEREGDAAAAAAVHAFGRTLQAQARAMSLTARYRWRSDTFLSVLMDTDARVARRFAGKVREAASGAGVPMPAVEAGVIQYHPGLDTVDEFIASAQHALQLARASARGSGPPGPRPAPLGRRSASRPNPRRMAS